MERSTELLTARELAKRLRVSPETVCSWARRGEVPALRVSAKVIRYDADAVMMALSVTQVKEVTDGK